MLEDTVRLLCPYGGLESHVPYKLVSTGFDHVVLKARGRIIYVPSSLVDTTEYFEDDSEYLEYQEED